MTIWENEFMGKIFYKKRASEDALFIYFICNNSRLSLMPYALGFKHI
jgi:hypothetical protein